MHSKLKIGPIKNNVVATHLRRQKKITFISVFNAPYLSVY